MVYFSLKETSLKSRKKRRNHRQVSYHYHKLNKKSNFRTWLMDDHVEDGGPGEA